MQPIPEVGALKCLERFALCRPSFSSEFVGMVLSRLPFRSRVFVRNGFRLRIMSHVDHVRDRESPCKMPESDLSTQRAGTYDCERRAIPLLRLA